MERVVKVISKVNPLYNLVKEIGCSHSAVSQIRWKYKINVVVKYEYQLVDHEKHQNVRLKNSKQYTLKIGNEYKHKWKTNGPKQESIFVTEL